MSFIFVHHTVVNWSSHSLIGRCIFLFFSKACLSGGDVCFFLTTSTQHVCFFLKKDVILQKTYTVIRIYFWFRKFAYTLLCKMKRTARRKDTVQKMFAALEPQGQMYTGFLADDFFSKKSYLCSVGGHEGEITWIYGMQINCSYVYSM